MLLAVLSNQKTLNFDYIVREVIINDFSEENKIIKILLPSGEIRDLEQYSNVINGLTSSSYKKIDRLYYSGELDE